ncbi:MAG: MCE family protein [Bdellovibrio sp.]|nr:MCE family protein [Bdellovibrio sp.]
MNEFKVGLLALIAMGAVVFMSLKITSNQSGFGNYRSFKTIVKDASGIFPKTPIKVAGINAGRIKSIELENNAALITFEILSKVTITKGSKLKIKTIGFLGDKYLEITIAENAEPLAEDAFIEAEEGAGIEKLMKDASEVVADVKKITTSLKESLAPEGKEAPVTKILNDVKELTGNVRTVSETLKRVITGNEEQLKRLIDNLEKFSKQIRDETDKTRDKSLAAELKEILANTKNATHDLKVLMADIRSGKGSIGKFLVEEEIADKVNTALSSVNRLVNNFNSIRTEVNAFTGANSDYGADTRAQVRIFPSPERFYVLGLSTSEFGPENERHTTITQDGTETRRVENYRDKNSFRFDIQMGRRVQSVFFRGGLIESTGGLGVDYLVQRWGTTFTAELFDYREGVGPNVRLASEIRLWNIFHMKVMMEDLIISTSRSFSALIGLKFNDEDLRNLIGFFL